MIEQYLKFSTWTPFKEALLDQQSFELPNLWHAPKALVVAAASYLLKRQVIVITSIEREAKLLADITNVAIKEPLSFPAWETLPSENIEPSPDIVGERALALMQIAQEGSQDIVVTNLQAVIAKVIARKDFQKKGLELKVQEDWGFELLMEELVELGYQRVTLVQEKGEFAVRGGILDVFPSSQTEPMRIEFFGDTIESMRAFDPISQTSVRAVSSLWILPTKELEFLKKEGALTDLFSYFSKDALIVLDEPFSLKKKYQELASLFDLTGNLLLKWESFVEKVHDFQHLLFQDDLKVEKFKALPTLELAIKPFDEVFVSNTKIVHEKEQTYLMRLPKLGMDEYQFTYICQNDDEENTLKEQMLATYDKIPSNMTFERGNWSSGWVFPLEKKAYVASVEVTQRYVIKRKKQRSTRHVDPVEFMELIAGDHVVHLQHGIGRYLGCERKTNHEGIETEYLNLEYADQARLFVPLEQSHLVTKYIGSKHEKPTLHQIGGKSWLRTKVNTERAIVDYASELLKMYAQRALEKGAAYPEDSEDMKHFEREFPYAETEDQLQAIQALKEDVCSENPMDRLVCGDVGYGKTEVAMRAAFKAIVDGGVQVAVLVPTTILAMQHYETFCQRMENFPINIEVLSRFVPKKRQKEVLEKLKAGSIDLIIGTHRVISKDVEFKKLGLVIIDEEQRFGVKAKERLRAMKQGADCLTLSATPIPRTLYMSLVGARDISLINSPPQDRLPIKTHIVESEPHIIQQAILRELAREGQVYIIHNRVASIYRFAEKIQTLVPSARVQIAHGQMDADALDQVFHAFKNNEADVLIATTIVESGVDIPNANTIMIDHADKYGLADLYQLRGRVGRWNRKAYAYFMVQKNKSLLEIAQKRLAALVESSGHGGGMKIAMRDLEIRGAGEILGTSQSGHVSAIGFHLYCKLLKRTILSMQGKAPKTVIETKIEFPVDRRIPPEYIPDLLLRMEMYQRLGDAFEIEQLEKIYEEMVDRFGQAPPSVNWLYHVMRLKVFSGAYRFTEILYKKNFIKVERSVKGKKTTYQIPYVLAGNPELFEQEVIFLLKKVL